MKPDIQPVTPDRWSDLEELFGERGACAGCWCMWWKLPRKTFDEGRGEQNRRSLQQVVQEGPPPGLIAYVDGVPAAWCAIEPRDRYSRLSRSRILAPVDDREVWSITCFFVDRQFRGSGLMRRMIEAATDWARQHGASLVEAYPVDRDSEGKAAADSLYTGVASTFRKARFDEVVRRSPIRPIMRRKVRPTKP